MLAMPGYMEVPPESTVLSSRSLQVSTSHFMMELKVVSWMPGFHTREGLEEGLGAVEPLVASGDGLISGQLIALLQRGVEAVVPSA